MAALWATPDFKLCRGGHVAQRRVELSYRKRRRSVDVNARSGPPRRLLPFVISIPKRIEDYFERSPGRRVVWCTISTGAGFYAGNVITLSFGALAINDVLAAVVMLLFYEAVSASFYGSSSPSLRAWFANYFKIGLVAATMADAVKLGS